MCIRDSYWSDYNGSDANHDGIGDTPYSIDNDSIDYKPLIRKAGLPIAYFHYEPSNNITTKDIIHFYDDSIDLDGTITSWLWNFGDGNTSNEQNPEHSYGNDGTFIVTLTITDNDGAIEKITKTITVAEKPPQRIIFVDDDFTNDPANHKWNTIQAAIDDASDGDIVFVFDGVYQENIFVNKRIKLVGEDTGKVTINGNSIPYTVNLLADGIVMENFTLRGGSEATLYVQSNNVIIKNCDISSQRFAVQIQSQNNLL